MIKYFKWVIHRDPKYIAGIPTPWLGNPVLICLCFCMLSTWFQFKTQYANKVVVVRMTVNETIFGLNGSQELTQEEMVPVSGSVNGVNALGMVVFSICFGLIIGSMGEQGRPLRDFFDCLNEAIMRLVAIIMWWVDPGGSRTRSRKWGRVCNVWIAQGCRNSQMICAIPEKHPINVWAIIFPLVDGWMDVWIDRWTEG